MTFEELLKQYGISHLYSGHRHCTRGFVQFDCPVCSPQSHKYRMGYNLSKHYTRCWVCGHIDLVKVAVSLFGIDYATARNLERSKYKYTEKREPGKLKLPSGICELGKVHKRYLSSRQFDPDQIQQQWGVNAIAMGHPLAYRLFIPIFDRSGQMISWTARTIIDSEEKRYHSATPEEEQKPHKEVLYGAEKAKHTIIITEGPTDVWRIGPGAVATFGTGWTGYQIREMVRYPIRVVCFDNEEEAQKSAKKLCTILQCYEGQTHRVVLSSPDPGSSDKEEIRELRNYFKMD